MGRKEIKKILFVQSSTISSNLYPNLFEGRKKQRYRQIFVDRT